RRALPAPDATAYATQTYAAPVGEVETALAAIWAEVLHVPRVGRGDDFFALGGHSLLAVTVIERMRRRGWRLDVRMLFATPTLAQTSAGVDPVLAMVAVPATGIPSQCDAITPSMLPLIALTAEEIADIVARV